ncbi:MAG: SOS response-associated peptidase [Methanomicrobiales archaeon]|nr:SOS response-associated peptidase [Methanomicrobiales archaeon]
MCGRFCIAASPGEILERYDVIVPDEYRPRYNISPANKILAISQNGTGNIARMHEWGITAGLSHRIINARIETVREKNLFRKSFEEYRCLIPASGYYEWKHEKTRKTPYYFSSQITPILSFAGFIRPSLEGEQVVILTTKALLPYSDIHDRMPVILDPAGEPDYLKGGNISIFEKGLDIIEVSPRVNQVHVDDPDLIKPMTHRSGQRTLG